MMSNLDCTSETPILDSIQTAANEINILDVERVQETEINIVVRNKEYQFLISKEGNETKAKYEGDLRIIIQKDSTDLIEKLIYAPEVLRYKCRDKKGNLLVHVLCWRGFEKYAMYFTDKENSLIRDCTGWTALHYACWSDNLDTVSSIYQYGNEGAETLVDNYGNYPIDLTDNEEVRKILVASHFD